MSKTIYFSKQDKIFTEDRLLLFVSVMIDKDEDGLCVTTSIDKVFVNISDKVSIDITAQVLANQIAVDLIHKELDDIYDEFIVRNVFNNHNEFNGKMVA